MDELNITPQPEGDKPEGNPEDNQSAPQPTEGQNEQASFDLSSEQKSDSAPNVEDQLLQPAEEASAEQPAEPAPVMEEQTNPAAIETPSPAEEVEEAPAPPAEETPETPEATTEEEAADSSVLTQNDAKPHRGIPKWALIAGGVVALGAVVVGAMFATDSWPFKGQVAEVIDEVPLIADVSPAAPEYCPDGEYYDPEDANGGQVRLELLDDAATDSGQNELRLLNAVPSAKAQNFEFSNVNSIDRGITPVDSIESDYGLIDARDEEQPVMLEADMEMIDRIESDGPTATLEGDFQNFDAGPGEDAVRAVLTETDSPIEVLTATQEELRGEVLTATQEELTNEGLSINNSLRAPLDVNTSTFDRSQCKPIPQDNCDLLDKMQENPSAYFLSPATEDLLGEWKNENCAEPTTPAVTEVTVPTCGENQELEASTNQCVCRPGYFELESPSYADDSNARIDAVDSATRATILEQAEGVILATDDSSPQNTLTLLDGNGDAGGLPINNNISDNTSGFRINNGAEDSTGLEINTNLSRLNEGLSVNRLQQFECVNCEELQARIDTLKGRVEGLDALDITDEQRATQESVLNAELARLEAKAAEENCTPSIETIVPLIPEVTLEERTCDELIQEITRIQGYPTTATTPEIAQELATFVAQAEEQGCDIPEKDACTETSESIGNYISQGDFRASYNEQIRYIDTACIAELDSCESKLAYSLVAREYRNSAQLADDITFFDGEYAQRRNSYMDDLSCVPDKQPRCDALDNDLADGFTFNDEGRLVSANSLVLTDGPVDSGVLTLNEAALDVTPDVLAARETNLLSQTNMSRLISDNLESMTLLSDKEYYDLYCQPYVPPTIDTITPIVPYSGEIQPTENPDPPISPAAPEPPVEDPAAPPAEPPVEPPTPEEELAAAAPDSDFQAPAAPSPDAVDTGETTIEPPAPTPTEEAEITDPGFVAPAAPAEPTVIAELSAAAPGEPGEMPEITESPEITKTGPEAYMFFFIVVASQVFYFRRRIYAFIENR